MILDKLVKATEKRVAAEKKIHLPQEVKKQALALKTGNFAFENAIKREGISFICEVKKASPSKGIIAEDFPYVEIAEEYEKAGATCISVLTETDYFLGSIDYLKSISENVSIPIIRKDFIIDEYMIYEAKIYGADCVLLICSILNDAKLKQYIEICDKLGLSALVEAHDEGEINRALKAGARMIGVNNRDLKTFKVDISNSERLRRLVPDNVLFIAESGIKTNEDIRRLKEAKVNGVLIGETLMRAENKKEILDELSK